MIRTTFAALLLIALAQFSSATARADDLVIASWNLENLFDTEDDPNVEFDEDFSPDKPKKWTTERLEIKLKNLSSIISKMNDGKGPTCSASAKSRIARFSKCSSKSSSPWAANTKSCTKIRRAAAVSIVPSSSTAAYSRSPIRNFISSTPKKLATSSKPNFAATAQDLFVFMNHWPSRHNDEWQRNKAADVLRKRIDEISAADPKADMIMLGDFNDYIDNASIRDHLRAVVDRDRRPVSSLLDTTGPILRRRQRHFRLQE